MHEIEPTLEAFEGGPSCGAGAASSSFAELDSRPMAVTVKIPAQLRGVTDGEGEVEVDGGTVGEALDAVFDQHDDLRERITEDGGLRRFVNVYVSGEDIRFQDGLETQLADGDEVTILPAVAGG